MRWINVRKVVLVDEDCVMRRLARSDLPGMAVQIIVDVGRADDARVDDSACGTVPAAVGVGVGSGEEEGLVTPADDDERNGWPEAQFCTCLWTVIIKRCPRDLKGAR
jgi:hypothetical protein